MGCREVVSEAEYQSTNTIATVTVRLKYYGTREEGRAVVYVPQVSTALSISEARDLGEALCGAADMAEAMLEKVRKAAGEL